jgi:putative acetyltransferase
VKVRRATQQDCDSLSEIQVSAIRGLGRSHYSDTEIDTWSRGIGPEHHKKAIAERCVIVAERDSKAVGFGTLDAATGSIAALYVLPEFARQGIGTAILEELIREARRCGLTRIHCESSLCAEAFYVSAGFEAGPRRMHRFRSGEEIGCVPVARKLDRRD